MEGILENPEAYVVGYNITCTTTHHTPHTTTHHSPSFFLYFFPIFKAYPPLILESEVNWEEKPQISILKPKFELEFSKKKIQIWSKTSIHAESNREDPMYGME